MRRGRLEALETTTATCGRKERALVMVNPRNFGWEVVLRVVPYGCNDGRQRASFELLVKKAISHFLVLRVSLLHRLHSATFVMASCMAASATYLLGRLLKVETSFANMATSTFSGITRRRSSMYNRKRSGDRTDP